MPPASKIPRLNKYESARKPPKMKAKAKSMESKISMREGTELPFIGFGTYLLSNDEAETCVEHAIRRGYRHIDTASYHANEEGIARGIGAAGVPRAEIFITAKLQPGGVFGQPPATYEGTLTALEITLEKLGTSYLDLYLIHHAGAKTQRLEQWRALCDACDQGLVRAIGVSNYSEKHIEEIEESGMKMPQANQIEVHPLCSQKKLIDYLRNKKILPIAYSSLAPCLGWRVEEDQGSLKTDEHRKILPLLDRLAAKHDINQAQLLLKWALQKGLPVIPKSSKLDRIESNQQLFHFDLDNDDMAQLDAIDEDAALAWPSNPLHWE